jgi:sulfur carrier protein
MQVNGRTYTHHDGLTLHRLLAELELRPANVVVMHGNNIYRAGKIPDITVTADDVIEIVKMMQGG